MLPLIDERAYLPNTISDLPLSPWLILAPHADDESFGMGGSIALAREANIDVFIIIMTDGSLGGDAEERRNEAMQMAKIAGIQKLFFLEEKDRELYPHDHVIQKTLNILYETHAKSLFFPHPLEPHPDHRACASIAWEALRYSNFLASGYSYEISTQGLCNMLLDITSVVSTKKIFMNIYGSQLPQNNYTDVILSLNKTRTWSLHHSIQYAEAFYRWDNQNKTINDIMSHNIHLILEDKAIPISHKNKGNLHWIKNLLSRLS